MALSVCFIFTITIGVFPAVTVEVKSSVAEGGAWGRFGHAGWRLAATLMTPSAMRFLAVDDLLQSRYRMQFSSVQLS